ncbi:MAG: ATP-binding protein [Ferruginibacter sp.]
MIKKIKILHLEDVESDADLVKRILKKGNIESEILVVDTKEAYVAAIIEFAPDVILSDHTLPSFNSADALNIFLQSGMKIPFILVTATVSEEYAVSVIKAGANDYVLKDHLEKLPAAIVNSIDKIESEIHIENQKALKIREKTNAVLMAQELERSHMAYELLENINQILAASNLYIDCAISEDDKRMIFMQNSKKYILMAIDEIKSLSQVIMPPTLSEIGLIDSLNNWIEFKQQSNRMNKQQSNGMKFTTHWKDFNERVTSDKLQLTIYRIVQEQLNNTIKYSNAQNVYISLEQTDGELGLTIKDDGVGFDTSKHTKGVGLQNINTRAEIHNGKMQLESQPGKGCVLTVLFPI